MCNANLVGGPLACVPEDQGRWTRVPLPVRLGPTTSTSAPAPATAESDDT